MRTRLLIVSTLLIPVAFSGGYVLATANARATCRLQAATSSLCGAISSEGTTSALIFGIVGVVVWAIGWAIVWAQRSERQRRRA